MASPTGSRSGTLRTFVADGFDDPRLERDRWNSLLACGDSDLVFLTWEFQRAWWDAFGYGEPLFVVVERGGEISALAPFYADEHSIGLLGEHEAEWLDFIGDVQDDETVAAVIAAARAAAPPSAQFELQRLPGWHPRLRQLEAAAERLGEQTYTISEPMTPIVDLAAHPEETAAAARLKALREDRWLRRNGELVVEHLSDGEAILPHLDHFFDQHVARWDDVEHGWSRFRDPESRLFVEQLTRLMAATGWLRFTRLLWNGRPVAYDYNLFYGGRYHLWLGTFAIDFARRSPGAVMTRHVLLNAIEEGAELVDWGPGRLAYKLELATRLENVCWWGTVAS